MGYESFDIRIWLQKLLKVQDFDTGELVESWINYKELWAKETELQTGNSEDLRSDTQITAIQKTVFEIRYIRNYKKTLSPEKCRVVHDGLIYDLKEIHKTGTGRNKYLRLVTVLHHR